MPVQIPANVLQALRKSKLMLFIGAGFGHAARMPSGGDLAKELARELAERLPGTSEGWRLPEIQRYGDDLKRVAQVYADAFGGSECKQRVCELLMRAQTNADPALPGFIADLPPMTIFTTNYDELLELGLSDQQPYAMIFKSEHLARLKQLGWNIVKLHGHIDEPESIVVTKDDYDRYDREHAELIEHFRSQLRTHTTVVIGSALEDENLRRHFKEICEDSRDTLVYVLVQDAKDPRRAEWSKYSVQFIEGEIASFLPELHRLDEAALVKDPVIPQPPNAGLEGDCNPFRYFRTDDVLPNDLDVVWRYFTDPIDFAKILESGNTIIEGHRGSGKSWILRYLSVDVQLSAPNPRRDVVGFYVKCKPSAFDCTRRRQDDTDDSWRTFFTHYFNTFVISRIVETFAKLVASGRFAMTLAQAQELCEQVSRYIFHRDSMGGGDTPARALSRLYDDIELLGDDCRTNRDQVLKDRLSSSQALENFIKYLRREFATLLQPSTKTFLLLDELDNLNEDQQAIVNTYPRDRSGAFSFKIAVQSGHWVKRSHGGAALELVEDYSYVTTDRVPHERDFVSFLRELADRRLTEEQFNLNVTELLPQRPTPCDRTKKALDLVKNLGRDFSGFRRYALLASGNTRHFVSLLKDTVYVAFPDIATRKLDLAPIPWKVQNRVVKMKAAAHARDTGLVAHPEEVEALVDALGGMFKQILGLTLKRYEQETTEGKGDPHRRYDRVRQVSQVAIADHASLSPGMKLYLQEADQAQLLQLPFLPRQPQRRGESIQGSYTLHRLLCPYYEVSLADRHPRRVRAGELELALTNPARFVDDLTKDLRTKGEDSDDNYAPLNDSEGRLDLDSSI